MKRTLMLLIVSLTSLSAARADDCEVVAQKLLALKLDHCEWRDNGKVNPYFTKLVVQAKSGGEYSDGKREWHPRRVMLIGYGDQAGGRGHGLFTLDSPPQLSRSDLRCSADTITFRNSGPEGSIVSNGTVSLNQGKFHLEHSSKFDDDSFQITIDCPLSIPAEVAAEIR